MQANAAFMNEALGAIPGVQVPQVPPGRTHVYYQYCVYGPSMEVRDALVGACVRRGVDIETLHVDVPPDMALFDGARAEAEGARLTTRAIQIPIYAGLTRAQVERVGATVRGVLSDARHPSGAGRAAVESRSGTIR